MRLCPQTYWVPLTFVWIGLVLSFLICGTTINGVIDFNGKDDSFNVWLSGRSLNNRNVALNYVDADVIGRLSPDVTKVVSHHSFSYRDRKDSLLSGSIVDFFFGGIMETSQRTQFRDLVQQVQDGVRAFDIRLSKDPTGKIVVDNGIVYGTVSDFADALKQTPTGIPLVVYYKKSIYTPQKMSDGEMTHEVSTSLSNLTHVTHKLANITVINSDDYAEILKTTRDVDDDFSLLALYRDLREVTWIFVGLFIGYWMGILLLGWIVFLSYNFSKSGGDYEELVDKDI